MKIQLDAQLRPIRPGIEAYAASVHLTGHGRDAEEALDSLRRGVRAWCIGLQCAGELERVLRRRGIPWESDGDTITVDLRRIP